MTLSIGILVLTSLTAAPEVTENSETSALQPLIEDLIGSRYQDCAALIARAVKERQPAPHCSLFLLVKKAEELRKKEKELRTYELIVMVSLLILLVGLILLFAAIFWAAYKLKFFHFVAHKLKFFHFDSKE